jgi:cellulose synthase operon protein C
VGDDTVSDWVKGRGNRRSWGASLRAAVLIGTTVAGTTLVPILELALMAPAAIAQAAVPTEVRRGFTLLGEGLVNDAITVFQAAIRRYPDVIEAKLGLAIAYRRAGRDADAWQAYQTVLIQEPNNTLALKTVGILGGFRAEWQSQGIQALTTLLSLTPNDTEARAQRALLYGYQGQFAAAIADYDIVLQGNPSPDAIVGAAQVYTYSGNVTKGLELFNRYRSLGKPLVGNAAIAYSRALRGSGNAALAIQTLQTQLPKKLDETGIQMRSELSQAYLDNQQPTEALAILDPLRDRRDARLPLARALNELGQRQNLPVVLAEAAGLYKQVLQETPNPSAVLLREVADVLSAIPSEQTYALQLYQQLAQQQPNDVSVSLQQVALESQLGLISRTEARQRLKAALEPFPQDLANQTAIARALIRLEPDAELLPIYQRLAQAGVNEPFLQIRIAQLLIEREDFAGANAAIAAYRATPTGAKDQTPELLLAEMERRQNNLDGSAQRYQTLIANTATDSDIQIAAIRGLAGIRLAQNRPTEALALYDQLLAKNPQDLPLKLGRTSVAYQANRISEAEAEAVLNQWLQTRPASDTPRELYSLVGALPAADRRESLYTTLIETDPNYIPVQVRYVELLATRDPRIAKVQMNRLLARVRSSSASDSLALFFLKGQLAQALGELDQASAAYEQILARQPENADALLALGGVQMQQRRYDAAMNLYSQVLDLQPDSVAAQRSLAELSVVQGNPLLALEQLEQIQLQLGMEGATDANLARRKQQIEENMLRQRGFQPPWERY